MRFADRFASRIVLSAIAALGMASPSHAKTQFIAPDKAPAAWLAYAKAATETISGWLNGNGAPALKVRAAMDAVHTGADAPAPLIVKIWLGRDGTLSRVDFASLGSPAADQGLKDLLVGRRLPIPPKHMRQPLGLALQPQPRPVASDTAALIPPAASGAF